MIAHQSDESIIYTIGHSNQSTDAFLDLLRQHEIDVVVDVRSSPFSRFVLRINMRVSQLDGHYGPTQAASVDQ